MDERVRQHAEILVDYSTDIEPGDRVVVRATAASKPLVTALHAEIGSRGAIPIAMDADSSYSRAYLTSVEPDDIPLADHLLAAVEETDAYIAIRGGGNRFEEADVPTAAVSAWSRVQRPILETRLSTKWVATQHPTPDAAQSAQMSTESYADFVYAAVTKDWDAQRAFQEQLVDILNEGSEIHIVSGDDTDLHMSIDEMIAINDAGKHNLPGGEVFTAPVADSTTGTVLFDKPVIRDGREIIDAYLEFEDGRVVDFDAAKNVDLLEAVLNTDDGARRLGELGIGMTRDIDRFTANMLFDEKMGDTVHLALGRAYEETVPDSRERNDSAVHQDMIVDMSEDSHIEVDGELVQQDGTFRFEDAW